MNIGKYNASYSVHREPMNNNGVFGLICSLNEHEFCNKTQMFAIFRNLTQCQLQNLGSKLCTAPYIDQSQTSSNIDIDRMILFGIHDNGIKAICCEQKLK